MKKDGIFAIVLGFLVGLAATYGLFQLRQGFTSQAGPIISPLADNTAQSSLLINDTSKSPDNSPLLVISPTDESLTKESKTTVSGTTLASSWVLITGEKGDRLIQADSKGDFETEIALVSGENTITTTSFTSTDSEKYIKSLTVVYSTSDI